MLGQASSAPTISAPLIQTKLLVGAAHDNHEIEADRVATQIMTMPDPDLTPVQRFAISALPPRNPIVHRVTPPPAKGNNGFEASSHFENRLHQSGGGQPLSPSTRNFMEPRFGRSLDHLRIHTGKEAVQLNREIGAQAFTHGPNIYFGAGKYNPDSSAGKTLIAHEITHTFQQGASGGSAQRFIQRTTLKEQLVTQLAIPPALQSVIRGVSALGSAELPSIIDLPSQVLKLFYKIYLWGTSGLQDIRGKAGRITQLVHRTVQEARSLFTTAFRGWASLSPETRTLICYVTGAVIYWASKHLPSRLVGPQPPDLFITAKHTEETQKTMLSKALGWLTEWITGPAEPTQAETSEAQPGPALTPPPAPEASVISSVEEQAASGTSGGFKAGSPSVKGSEASAPSPAQAGPAPTQEASAPKKAPKKIRIKFLIIHIDQLDTRRDHEVELPAKGPASTGAGIAPSGAEAEASVSEKPKKRVPGGLFIKARADLELFNSPPGKSEAPLSLFMVLPWVISDPIVVELTGPDELEYKGPIDAKYFVLSDVKFSGIKINDEGLKEAKFNLGVLDIRHVASVEDLEATYKHGEAINFKAAKLDVNLFGYHLSATDFALDLDSAGGFVSGKATQITAGDSFKARQINLNKEKGFILKEAKLTLPEVLQKGEVTFNDIVATKEGKISGEGKGVFKKLKLIGDALYVDDATFNGKVNDEGWSIGMKGKPKLNLGQDVHFDGSLNITYEKKKGEKEGAFTKESGLKNGNFQLTLNNMIKVDSKGVNYDINAQTLKATTSTLKVDINKLGLANGRKEVAVTVADLVLGPNGFDFKDVHIKPGNITLFEGLSFTNPDLSITKEGDNYTFEGQTGLRMNFHDGNVKGKADQLKLAFTKAGHRWQPSGSLDDFRLTIPWGELLISHGRFDKEGFEAKNVSVQRNKDMRIRERTAFGLEQNEINQVSSLPVTATWAASVDKVSYSSAAGRLKLEGLKSTLTKMGFNFFNTVKGEVDFKKKTADLSGGFTFPPLTTPAWPLKVGLIAPLQPGLEFNATAEVGGHLKADLSTHAKAKPKEEEEGAGQWELDLDGGPRIDGQLYGQVSVGIYVGSQVIFAVGAALDLKVPLDIHAETGVEGKLLFNSQDDEHVLKPLPGFAFNYESNAALKAELNATLRAKYLYFFERELYKIKIKEWDLGGFKFGGKIHADEAGKLKLNKEDTQWHFLGAGKKPKPPQKEGDLFDMEELKALLAEAGYDIKNAPEPDKEETKAKHLQTLSRWYRKHKGPIILHREKIHKVLEETRAKNLEAQARLEGLPEGSPEHLQAQKEREKIQARIKAYAAWATDIDEHYVILSDVARIQGAEGGVTGSLKRRLRGKKNKTRSGKLQSLLGSAVAMAPEGAPRHPKPQKATTFWDKLRAWKEKIMKLFTDNPAEPPMKREEQVVASLREQRVSETPEQAEASSEAEQSHAATADALGARAKEEAMTELAQAGVLGGGQLPASNKREDLS